MTSLKSRFKPTTESAVSGWSRVKRGMNAWVWARVPRIPWTANLPVSSLSAPPDQPDPFEKLLLWLQSAYENAPADRVGVRVAR